MTVVNLWAGGTTDSEVRVAATVSGVSSVRLAVSESASMTSPAFSAAATPDAQGAVKLHRAGLDPSRRYWYQLETDSALDGPVGTFLTHPPLGVPGRWAMWAASCSGQGTDHPVSGALAPSRFSDHPVHELLAGRALNEGWLLGAHIGDRGYPDIGSGQHSLPSTPTVQLYRDMFDSNLMSARQQQMHLSMAIEYQFDDHDGGPNDHDGTFVGIPMAQQAYREKVPHRPLPDDQGSYYSFGQVARTLVISSDVRTFRSPNSDPDTASKTMLGAAQKQWMHDLLSTSDAKFLLWLMPDRWRWTDGTGQADSWSHFSTERRELVEMLGDLGWLGRVLLVTGDAHNLGIDTGTAPGQPIPMVQAAPLDANPSAALPSVFDHTAIGGTRGNYCTLDVDDRGTEIRVTIGAWTMSTLQGQHTLTVPADPVIPPPPPVPAPVAEARIRNRVTWLGVHAATGRVIAELPEVRGEIGRLLSAYDSSQLTIPTPLAGPGHVPIELLEQATQPIVSAVVAVVNDLPVWMGWVLSRRGGTGAEMQLATITPEGYLLRRRVRDHDFGSGGVDRALAAAALIGDAGPLPGVGAGLGLEPDVELTGDIIHPEWLATDRLTVYDALRELCLDDLEFTVDLDWDGQDRNVVRKFVRIRRRIGKHGNGESPLFETTASSLFESRAGSEASYVLLEDATTGRYANHVTAIAPGEGDDQPASPPALDLSALAGGVPIVEHVVELSSAEPDQPALDRAAQAERDRLHRGAEVWEINARWDAYPRLGVDAQIGDDVAWALTGHRHPAPSAGQPGVMGRGRMIGWRLDQQAGTWRPILLDPQEA